MNSIFMTEQWMCVCVCVCITVAVGKKKQELEEMRRRTMHEQAELDKQNIMAKTQVVIVLHSINNMR